MIKYCKSCGKEYKGDWCEHCGHGKPDIEVKAYDKYKVNKPERFMTEEELQEKNRLREKQLETQEEQRKGKEKKSRSAQKKKSSQWTFIITVALVFVGVVLFTLYSSGVIFKPADKNEVIQNYFYSIAEKDFDKYISTMIAPMADEYRQELEEKGLSKTDFMGQSYADYTETFGEGFSITKFSTGREVQMSAQEIKASQQTIKAAFGKSYTIKEAYRIPAEVTYEGPVSGSTMNYYVYVGKIKNKWYILNIEG